MITEINKINMTNHTSSEISESPFSRLERRASYKNIGDKERLATIISGGALTVLGIAKRSPRGWALALLGGGLIYRSVTGHCGLYQALGVDHAHNNPSRASVKQGQGINIERSMTINKSPEELFRFWRNFENLPRFMNHLLTVEVIDSKRSHWTSKAPAGMSVEWNAEIINEIENELIAWRSLEGATVPNAGSVRFEPAPNRRGSIVRVTISYDAPGGTLGSAIAKLFGEAPEQQIEEDLRRFKQLIETGEIASTTGQASSRRRAL
jgi:uncharacterized membrane protein